MLFRKMLRDMKLHKTQFISIFLMSFLGVFIYAGVGGEWYGYERTTDRYYEECNLSDIWIYGNGFTKEEVLELLTIESVKEVDRRLVVNAVAELENNPEVTLYSCDQYNISTCKVIKGEVFSQDKEGVWLDNQFAKARGLEVGDEIRFKMNGLILDEKIRGLVMNPEAVYAVGEDEMIPNHANSGFAYLSEKSIEQVMELTYNQILVTVNNHNMNGMEEKIETTLKGRYSVYITRKSQESYAMFDNEMKQHKTMGDIFPIAFLIIALLTILTTMTRMVNNQRIQIGTLKALGLTNRKIIFHFVGYGFVLSLLGGVLGTIIGPLTLPYLFYDAMKTAYTLPEWSPAILPGAWIMVLVTVLSCTLVSYLACRKILKEKPAQALRPKMLKVGRVSRFETSRMWSKMGFGVQWNIRDITRSKLRSIMAIVGIIGCMGLLVCAFGMKDSLDDVLDWQYKDLNLFESKLTLEEGVSTDQVSSIMTAIDGESIMEKAIEIKADQVKKSGQLTITDHVTLMEYTDKNRKQMTLSEDGLAISYKMAELLKVDEGDTISWHIYGDESWVEGKVSSIYRDPTVQGITMSRELYETMGFSFVPTSILTDKITDQTLDGVESRWTSKSLAESYETMTEAMNIMVYILIFGAAILAIVVLYNLGVLSYTERERELATLKVIGFKTKKLRGLLLVQNILLSLSGILPGIYFGRWLIDYMLQFMGDGFDMMCVISWKSIILSVIITVVLSVFTNLLFSTKLKRIDMVSSLKGME